MDCLLFLSRILLCPAPPGAGQSKGRQNPPRSVSEGSHAEPLVEVSQFCEVIPEFVLHNFVLRCNRTSLSAVIGCDNIKIILQIPGLSRIFSNFRPWRSWENKVLINTLLRRSRTMSLWGHCYEEPNHVR